LNTARLSICLRCGRASMALHAALRSEKQERMKEHFLRRLLSAALVFFAVLSLSGGSPLSAGRIERGISYLRAGDDKRALDTFSEVWASGEGEDRKLAMFYLDLVVVGGKDNIPSVEEARAAIRLKAESELRDAFTASEDYSGVKPAAVIYHTQQARYIDEEISGRYGGVEEPSPEPSVYKSGKPAANPKVYAQKAAGPSRVNSTAAGSVVPAAAGSPRGNAKKQGGGPDLTAARRFAGSSRGKAKKRIKAASLSAPALPRDKTYKPENEGFSHPSSRPYVETVVAGGNDGGWGKVVAVASVDRGSGKPTGRPVDIPVSEPLDTAAIKVEVSDGEPAGQVYGFYGIESSRVAVAAASPGEETSDADIKTARLERKKKTFVVEDAYTIENEPPDEFVSEVCFKINELELAGDAMPAVAAAAEQLPRGASLTVRGLSSPYEKNAESLSMIRAKLIERLLKKKFDVPSAKMNVEWGVGVNQDDRKVLLLVRG